MSVWGIQDELCASFLAQICRYIYIYVDISIYIYIYIYILKNIPPDLQVRALHAWRFKPREVRGPTSAVRSA